MNDWTIEDLTGDLVILASSEGIKNLFESRLDSQASHGDMEFRQEGIDIVLEKKDPFSC